MTWRERIQAARARGHFTDEDRRLALSWTTCAVGEASSRVGIDAGTLADFHGQPVHEVPGCAFVSAVFLQHFDHAEALLDQIEDRALQLKREGLTAAVESDAAPASGASAP